jgi:hypothetical protein
VRGLLALLLVVLGALPAAGEHEIWYRYTVLGYVKDARGKPLPGRRIELVRDRTTFSYLGDTDDAGFYVIIARLGDESAGETLTLHLDTGTIRLTATFDPTNHIDERGTRVDWEGARGVERQASFRSTLATFIGATR